MGQLACVAKQCQQQAHNPHLVADGAAVRLAQALQDLAQRAHLRGEPTRLEGMHCTELQAGCAAMLLCCWRNQPGRRASSNLQLLVPAGGGHPLPTWRPSAMNPSMFQVPR